MTIIIPVCNQSIWQDHELRFCLRGIEANITGVTDILIIGHLPDFIRPGQGLYHLPFKDQPGYHKKEWNIHNKVMAGFAHTRKKELLFFNDDYFIMSSFQAEKFPYHHKGLLNQSIAKQDRNNRYYLTLKNTEQALAKPLANNFDSHCPILYEAGPYRRALQGLPWPNYGYAIKTMYCESNGITGEYYPDLKLHDANDLKAKTKDRHYFSIGDGATGPQLYKFLQKKFPRPSVFEK
jgi:hypothetical protein